MKTRAILFFVQILLITAIYNQPAAGQDTIYPGSFPSSEAFKELTEQLRIMELTLQENLKNLEFNSDSLAMRLDELRINMEQLPRPLIPEDLMYDLQQNLKVFEEDFMKDFQEEKYFQFQEEFLRDFEENFSKGYFSNTIQLKEESGKKEVLIKVEEDVPAISVNINGAITNGQVRVEIFDPAGKKQGSFSIENTNSSSKEVVNGSLNKNINSPAKGDWKVVVNAEKASGHIFINSMQQAKMHNIQ